MHNKIASLLELPQHEQRSDEWFAKRRDKLTSSDASTVLGNNPYSKIDELLLKKCGYEHKFPFVGNIATLHGQKYEDEAIELYCKIMNKTNYNFGLISYKEVHEKLEDYNENYNFLAGSPDGIVENNEDEKREPILLEVKCPFKRKIIDGYIPEYYVSQVQLNMFICNLKLADYIEYCPKTQKINIVRINIDYKWLDENIPKLQSFWDKVMNYRNNGGIEQSDEYIKLMEKERKRIIAKSKRDEKNKMEKKKKSININNELEDCNNIQPNNYLFID